MSAIYDNWERLVAATIKREQLWQLFHADSRSPSILSEASDLSSPLHNAPPKLVLLSDFSPAFDVKDVSLASAKLLGKGTFGSTYTAAMDNGVTIVVKRLKPGSVSELDFVHNMDIVGNVRHENVAPPRAYYSSKNERIMMYDYYNEGSVYSLLHGQNARKVCWQIRLTIAIGAARGIAEIHKENGGTLVHGNIKASNVFLTPHPHCCVSDMGLANMIETTFMSGARCHAPEVKKSRNVSQAADVYNFGILLLELLTRKPSVHVPGGPEALDLVKLVSSVRSKKGAANVFDADLLQYPTRRDEMVKMLQIGIKCVAKSMNKRPKMYEVVKMLEDILKINPISPTFAKQDLVFVKDANLAFSCKDVSRAYAEVIGKGIFRTFGTSYKARLENGNTIVVKSLRGVKMRLIDFARHMEVFGTMSHENVAKIMAYYFSRDEKLLVYHYYEQTSAYDLLHGKRDNGRILLGWRARMKIAVGAARGIAHIHAYPGRKLVHGSIKSSNVFLNSSNYGIISDAGLTQLRNFVRNFVRRSASLFPGYCAPEVWDTWEVFQASDVYSFGVLLLELVTGRPSRPMTDDGKVISLVRWVQSAVSNRRMAEEVFEVELLKYQNMEAMTRVLFLALDCVNFMWQSRPTMSKVVEVLEEISCIEPSNRSGLEDASNPPSINSRFEDILEDLLPTLAP